jgi:demethylmenaquinone methyltransferase/2-methoxy-6-polyprenyl-1,4-benzoquinol methylase
VGGGSLDGATVSFGIRNVDRYPECLRAVAAALRPGGVLAVLEFSMPGSRSLRLLYRFYFRRLLPLAGRLLFDPQGAYTYLPESVDRFPAGADFEAVLRRAGLKPLSTRPLSHGIVSLYLARKSPAA